MNRDQYSRHRRARATLLVLAMLLLPACAHHGQLDTAPIAHIVLIKLQDPAESDQLIDDSRAKLGAIGEVASLHVGRHLDIGRSTVDSDYDACLTVGFRSIEAYHAYLEHPLHVELVNDWRERWDWIRIYDVAEESP